MGNKPQESDFSIDKTVVLSRWFCERLPTHLLVIDLQSQQVIAADQSTFKSVSQSVAELPCPMAELLSDSVIAKINANESGDFPPPPWKFTSRSSELESIWKYACLLPGELGVLHQTAASRPADAAGFASETRDQLTGLGTRDSLLPTLEMALAYFRTSDVGFALLFLDVDHFKKINDQHGHLAGDEVLRRAAGGILHAIRPGDGAIRYGGDEVVLVIGGLHSREEAAAVGRRVAGAIPPVVDHNNKQIAFTISMGIAYSRFEDLSPQAILQRADQAMYRAKSRGRCGEIVLD
jgi:diguanylate cyclase (GGDEF)-like protein